MAMNMAKTTHELQQQIERLVQEHVAEQQKAACDAVMRAFAGSVRLNGDTRPERALRRRRAGAEMAQVSERLWDAVRARPGETMAVIADHLGESARALHRPMLHLKRSGRVRTAGQRHLTRYFPMSVSKSG